MSLSGYPFYQDKPPSRSSSSGLRDGKTNKEGFAMIDFTQHAQLRAAQWNLQSDEVDYVIRHGEHYHQAGALIYYLRHRDIPWQDRQVDRWMRLEGTAIILSKDGQRVITVWRNQRDGLNRIKRKPKFELTQEQLQWNL
jgi:hypothetical protein